MRALLALALLLCSVLRASAAPAPLELIGPDPFCLLDAEGAALSLQDSRTAPGTRVILAEYRGGRRADQRLRALPSNEPGWILLGVDGSGRVLEVQDNPRDPAVLLVDPASRDGQKWRIDAVSPGRFRIVSKARGLALSATRGARPAVAPLTPSGAGSEFWRIALQPANLAGDSAAAGGTLAGRFPTLARQVQLSRESWLDATLATRRLEDYWAGATPDLAEAMGLLVQDRSYALAPEERNHALTLLLWLVSQAAYERGDAITVALALANASLYAAGDDEVRAELRRDLLAHYRLYRATVEWQTGWAVDYRLSAAPLLVKLLWCYRSNQLEQNGTRLTLEEYRTFVDRVDVMEALQGWARAADVAEAPTLRGIVANLDAVFRDDYKYAHFMAMIRQWYAPGAALPEKATDDELYAYLTRPEIAKLMPDWVHEVLEDYRNGTYYVEVLGRRRDPQARMWVNYQWELHEQTGFFRGDCGTEAEVSMALWKSAGIAAMAVYHTGKDIGHAYAVYWDPFVGRFRSLQDLSAMAERYGGATEVTLHPMPLRVHDGFPLLQPRPRTAVASYTRFVARGIDIDLLAGMYFARFDGARPEAVFTPATCPPALPDRDGDGLWDEDELAVGTKLDDPDTDRDGFSDGWELERRFSPRDPASPSRADLGRVLVGHVVRVVAARSGAALNRRSTWRLVRSDETQYHFVVSPTSGLCLGIGEKGALVEGPLTGAATQKWKLLFRDGGAFVIQSRADGRTVALDADGGAVAKSPQNGREELWLIR